MTRSDAELVSDALAHIAALRRHLGRGDLADETIADAVGPRLAAAIEAVSQTSATFREGALGSDWKVIWATRNRIAHGYAYVDLTIILDTVEHDLPEFERTLRRSLE
ncbi:HepT-like ribonuclease domain-containing protein [Agromyces marinus]|uniref:DUF86 domain-containing protein n=1 Tax=Agromyces marinus TaxID=1389020 RepID=A0ABN6YBF8_9MICO|nr:HepT-like ribonuclease domain-containing protein [Agromyces marinus]UIP57487.1 hypothetical protein DSM26151_03480 [Agromyces marinus]BDZ54381.1 hypothetical protein GCM10025870_14540 [Agromyces marinus]